MNARLDRAGSGYFRMVASINNARNVHGGMGTIDGNPASNYEQLTVSGIVGLKKGDYMSQWIYSNSDNSWAVQHESGFSVTLLHEQSSKVGFLADLSGNRNFGRGWNRVSGFNTYGSRNTRMFNSGNFDEATGTFRAPLPGIYFVGANFRFDAACGSYFRLQVAVNGNADNNNGLMAIDGGPACDYAAFNVEGMVWLEENDRLEVYTYSNSDNSYYAADESGWSVTLIS